MRLSILLAVAGALALSAPGHAAAKPRGRPCGETARIHGWRFAVHKERGHAACRTVKPIITQYLRTFEFPRPWFCTLGHGGSPLAASCARHGVLVWANARA